MNKLDVKLPLHSGDRLTRAEFERRYEQHPDLAKAELVDGVVYVTRRVPARGHAIPHAHIVGWAGFYKAYTPRIQAANNGTLRLDLDNELQPDASVWIEDNGRAIVDEDDFLAGAPEFIIEVAFSSASYDLHDKLRVYRRNGIQEYLVLLTYSEEVCWFNWQGEEVVEIEADAQGVLCSRALPGLWLDAAAFWRGDLGTVLRVLQQGIDTPEHSAFVERLRASSEE